MDFKLKIFFCIATIISMVMGGCTKFQSGKNYSLAASPDIKITEQEAIGIIKKSFSETSLDLDNPIEIKRFMLPRYPIAARESNIEGTVVVSIYVDENGSVESILFSKLAHPLLNEAVIKAIDQWQFEPTFRDGKPAKFKIWQRIPFLLTD